MLNIRKWLCKLARAHKWRTLKNLCQCDKYYPVEINEPEPVPPPDPEPPTPDPPPPPPPDPPIPPAPKPDRAAKPLFILVCDILTAKGDPDKFLKAVAESGAWGIRIFANYSWGRGWMLTPFMQIGEWTHPTSRQIFPYFDLGAWNLDYWAKLKEIYTKCKENDLQLIVSLMDERPKDKTTKYFSPWYCSKQSLDPASTGGIYGNYLKPYHKNLARVIIEKLTAAGVSFRVEAANEFSDLGWIKDEKPEVPKLWYAWMIEQLGNQGIPDNRLIHSGWKEAVYDHPGIFSQHRVGRVSDVGDFDIPARVLLSGDGFFEGSGAADAKGRKGISEIEAKKLAQFIESRGFYGIEFMDRGLWHRDNANAHLDDFNPAPARAITEAWK